MGPPPPRPAPPRGGGGDGVAATSVQRGTQCEATPPASSSPPCPPGPPPPPPDPASPKMRLQNQVAGPERPQRAPNAPPTRRHQRWRPPATWSPPACGPCVPDRSGNDLPSPLRGAPGHALSVPRDFCLGEPLKFEWVPLLPWSPVRQPGDSRHSPASGWLCRTDGAEKSGPEVQGARARVLRGLSAFVTLVNCRAGRRAPSECPSRLQRRDLCF